MIHSLAQDNSCGSSSSAEKHAVTFVTLLSHLSTIVIFVTQSLSYLSHTLAISDICLRQCWSSVLVQRCHFLRWQLEIVTHDFKASRKQKSICWSCISCICPLCRICHWQYLLPWLWSSGYCWDDRTRLLGTTSDQSQMPPLLRTQLLPSTTTVNILQSVFLL